MNFDSGSPCAREPRAFRDGDYAAGFEEPPPFGEAPSETDVVDRPFGPDEVELPVPEGKVVHRPYEACDPVVQPGAPHAGLQAFDHLGQQVHGRDRAAEVAGQHFGLMAVPQPMSAMRRSGPVSGRNSSARRVCSSPPGPCRSMPRKKLAMKDKSNSKIGSLFSLFMVLDVLAILSDGRNRIYEKSAGQTCPGVRRKRNPFQGMDSYDAVSFLSIHWFWSRKIVF